MQGGVGKEIRERKLKDLSELLKRRSMFWYCSHGCDRQKKCFVMDRRVAILILDADLI